MKFWSHFHHPQAAMVLLRVTLAVLLLFHGWAKLRYGIGSIERMVESAGAPGWLAYAVYLGEVVAPLLRITTPAIAGASLFIAAGTLKDANGQSFSGQLGLTAVSLDQPPVALPKELAPDQS